MKTAERGYRFSLQLKLAAVLLVVALVPLVVSAFLIDQIAEVAQNFASHHVAELRPHLGEAQKAYRDLIAAKKQEYEENARRLAAWTEMGQIARGELEGASAEAVMERVLEEHADLLRAEVAARDGKVLARADRAQPANPSLGDFRRHSLRQTIGTAGVQLVLEFAADEQPVKKLQELGEAIKVSKRVDTVRSSLPDSYRKAFILLVGGVAVIVTLTGIFLASRMTRRIGLLVSGTRKVAGGDLEARVDLRGRDELAELAVAFNTMVKDLQKERQEILYLQRIGAWQDVARKLAHEIKNPLTPIQLVVQQCVSSYDGDDERFKKMLADCEEIVSEEISGLRRLVDAFRDLGRLPKVEAAALPMQTLLDDLQGDPQLAEHLELDVRDPEMTIRADRLLLRRALTNLVENGVQAGQAAGNPGRVRLTARQEGAAIRIDIEDEGAGIRAEDRQRIFDPYVTSKDTGTGLGLAIAKKVALDHRGSLRLEDEASELGGAHFVLEVPLADTEA
jgi:nitrogen fixation/metabolism regulation signal transduction histidine kinase